jgi:hypothetical protein
MSSEAERDPTHQKPSQQDPAGSVNPSDRKTNPSPGNQSQSDPPRDISKKNPSQGSDSQHQGQEKPGDEKRRAS